MQDARQSREPDASNDATWSSTVQPAPRTIAITCPTSSKNASTGRASWSCTPTASATPASMLTSTLEAVLKPSWKRLPLCRVRKQCWPNSLAKLRASRAAAELPYLLNEFTEHSLARAARVNRWIATHDFADPDAKQTTS